MLRRGVLLFVGFTLLCLLVRPASADGLIVIHHPPIIIPGHFTFAPLEVTYHHVDCSIDDQVAVTSVDQEFYNPNDGRPLEGEYIFPVPKDARIDKFTMDIDGKTVEAELLPADKARQIYEEIVRTSRDPALLEYAGRAMFRVRIFPIEAHGKKHVYLKYTELLRQDNGLLDYHYTLNTEKFSSKPLRNVSLKVSISSTEPITAIYSPTHDVEIKRHGENKATAGFEARDIRPDTDFHLFIGHKATPVGINLLTYRPDEGKEGYFVLLAAPTVNPAAKPLSKDVVFVMDTSGSMSGAKIEQARKALKYCVETLNPQDRFDIVRFSTEAEPFFGSLKDATDDNRKKAAEFALGLKASGGTAIDEALGKALEERQEKNDGRLFLLVFMTDGQPTVGEQDPDIILTHVKQAGKGAPIRIFSFGVGNDVNTKLLDLAAEQTRGYAQYVLPNENLEVSMSNFWGKVQDPILASLKLNMGDAQVAKIYPREMPDLFKGDQLAVFGTYAKAGNGAVTITGTADGKELTFAQDVTFADKTDSSREWIAKLWATRRVGYLLDEIRLHGENKELKDEVAALARRWGIVTPYTAMLIIEDERRHNVPVAQRSLREMERDRVASDASYAEFDSLRRGEATGGRAVGNSISSNAAKSIGNLAAAQAASEQKDAHFRADAAADLEKTESPASPAPTATPVYGGFVGGEKAKELNLGTASISGWQTATPGAAKGEGYRFVTNYAQQSRVINNRAFYLNGNQWTDSRAQNAPDAKPVTIIFNSDAYFDLLQAHPDAAAYLALGANVTVELGGTLYNIVEETGAK